MVIYLAWFSVLVDEIELSDINEFGHDYIGTRN